MQLTADPLLDIAPAIANVLPNPETGGTFTSVSPGVEGGDRHGQIIGKLLRREQAIGNIHDPDSAAAPFQRSVRWTRQRYLMPCAVA